MSSSSTINNDNVIDNKELQQATNNNANNDSAAASTTTTTTTNVVDNKSASQVALSSMYSPSPIPSTSASIAYACANLKAATLGAGAQTQRPVHISCAADLSSSMSGSRLTEMQSSLRFIVEQLRDIDSFGIVTFASDVATALTMTKMNAAGKQTALRAINAMRANGSTNLSGGLFSAFNQVTGGNFVPLNQAPPIQPSVPYMMNSNMVHISHPCMNPAYPAPFTTLPPPTATTPTVPVVSTIPVVISFSLDTSSNKPDEKYRYKLSIAPPPTDVTIAKFTIHDPENRFADIVGSGETEYDLKPLPTAIAALEVTFEFAVTAAAGGAPAKTHKITFHMGDLVGVKKTVHVPIAPTRNESPALRPREITPTLATNSNSNQIDDGIVRCVFLFTDGHANVGIRDAPVLVEQTKLCLAASPRDATIFTFGFGANHNAAMLQSVATAAEGMFYFIENVEMMPETFADCLGGIISTVATNVKITAKLSPGCGVRFGQLLTKFKSQILDDGNTIVFKLKDLYAEEKKEILIELKVDGPTAKAALVDNADAVVGVSWTLEYSDATVKSASPQQQIVTLHNTTKFVISSDAAPVVNADVDDLVQRFKSIEVLDKVREAADAGQLEKARAVANDYSAVLRAAPSASRHNNMMIQQQMQQLQEMALDANQWASRGTKQATSYAQSHTAQRGNAVTEDCAYEANEMKMQFRKKAMNKSDQ